VDEKKDRQFRLTRLKIGARRARMKNAQDFRVDRCAELNSCFYAERTQRQGCDGVETEFKRS
jgi:hypothetical protein